MGWDGLDPRTHARTRLRTHLYEVEGGLGVHAQAQALRDSTKGLSAEERRAKQRAMHAEIEAQKRHEQLVESVRAGFERRREAALAARFTPLDHSPAAAGRRLGLGLGAEAGLGLASPPRAGLESRLGTAPGSASLAAPLRSAGLRVLSGSDLAIGARRTSASPPPAPAPAAGAGAGVGAVSLFDQDLEGRRRRAIVRRLDRRAQAQEQRL